MTSPTARCRSFVGPDRWCSECGVRMFVAPNRRNWVCANRHLAPVIDQQPFTAPHRVVSDLGSATVRAERRTPLGAAGGSPARSAPPSCNTGGKSR